MLSSNGCSKRVVETRIYIRIAPNTMPASLLNEQIQIKLYIMVATPRIAVGIQKDSASFVGLPAILRNFLFVKVNNLTPCSHI